MCWCFFKKNYTAKTFATVTSNVSLSNVCLGGWFNWEYNFWLRHQPIWPKNTIAVDGPYDCGE